MRARVVVVALSWIQSVACGSPLEPAGTGCTVDTDCAAGLSCLPVTSQPGPDCMTIAKVCTKTCRGDADCAAVGPKFQCTPACSGAGTCANIQMNE